MPSVGMTDEKGVPSDAELIFQGAESRVYRHLWYGYRAVIKQRFVKSYLHPDLSRTFIKQRTRSEVRNILKCRAVGIDCPYILSVRLHAGLIVMEDLGGMTVSDVLKIACPDIHAQSCALKSIAQQLGKILAKLHDTAGVVHGDLTTSNLILRNYDANDRQHTENPQLALIDFGLSSTSDNIEDRAVDLYVLERAIKSNHPLEANMFNEEWLNSYGAASAQCSKTLKRLEVVRQRGRKRLAFG